METSDSSVSDSVEIMTPHMSPISDFRKVIGALTTPTTSLAKTILYKTLVRRSLFTHAKLQL